MQAGEFDVAALGQLIDIEMWIQSDVGSFRTSSLNACVIQLDSVRLIGIRDASLIGDPIHFPSLTAII
jgi:hypothetical protein